MAPRSAPLRKRINDELYKKRQQLPTRINVWLERRQRRTARIFAAMEEMIAADEAGRSHRMQLRRVNSIARTLGITDKSAAEYLERCTATIRNLEELRQQMKFKKRRSMMQARLQRTRARLQARLQARLAKKAEKAEKKNSMDMTTPNRIKQLEMDQKSQGFTSSPMIPDQPQRDFATENQRLRDALSAVLRLCKRQSDHDNGAPWHCHNREGRWDEGGRVCKACKVFLDARKLLKELEAL